MKIIEEFERGEGEDWRVIQTILIGTCLELHWRVTEICKLAEKLTDVLHDFRVGKLWFFIFTWFYDINLLLHLVWFISFNHMHNSLKCEFSRKRCSCASHCKFFENFNFCLLIFEHAIIFVGSIRWIFVIHCAISWKIKIVTYESNRLIVYFYPITWLIVL